MTPPQIIAQFRKVLTSIRADEALTDEEKRQRIEGAYAMAAQLVRSHPKLFAKGSATSYLGEIRRVYRPFTAHTDETHG